MSTSNFASRFIRVLSITLVCGWTLGCGDAEQLVAVGGQDASNDAADLADVGGGSEAGSDAAPDGNGEDAPVISADIDPNTLAPVDPTPVSAADYAGDNELEDFVLEYAVRFCNKLFTCESRAVSEYASQAGLTSPTTCMEYYRAHYAPERLSDGLVNGRLAFDAAAAPACVEALEQLPCEAFGAQIEELDDEFHLCPDVFTGQADAGEACFAHAECPGGHVCSAWANQAEAPACQGTCQPLDTRCGDTSCDPVTEYCDDAGTCQPRGAWGDSCQSRFECNDAYFCQMSADEPTCQPYTTGIAADTRCQPDTDVCTSGAFCFPYYPGGPQACRRLKLGGGTCLEGLPQDGCVASTYCERAGGATEAECVPRKRAGQACESGSECVSGRCAEGVCVAPETPCITTNR